MISTKQGWLVGLCVFLFALVGYVNFSQTSGQHFTILAESFLENRLDLVRNDNQLGDLDITFWDGRYYWHLGPFPSIVVLPAVWLFKNLGMEFYQGYAQLFVSLFVFFLTYKMAVIFGYKRNDAWALSFAFVFGSIYSFVAFYSQSWYFSQAVVTLLLLLSLHEFYTRKRYLLIGLLLAGVLASRLTAAITVIFFALSIYFEPKIGLANKMKNLLWLFLPLAVSGVLLLSYNQVRFSDPFETGYGTNRVKPDFQAILREKYGLFNLANIPTNFYWYFLATPRPILEGETYHVKFPYLMAHGWGMSFFIMSPIFIKIFFDLKKRLNGEKLFLWLTSLTILLVLLSWYSSGYFQVGPRYILDLLPLWFILLMEASRDRKISKTECFVIIISGLTNLFFVWTSLFPV